MPSNAKRVAEPSEAPLKRSRRVERLLGWDAIKDDVYRLYITEGKTLEEMRLRIKDEFSFTAGKRKWKMKLKEWKFVKNMKKADMNTLVATAEKRRRKIISLYWLAREDDDITSALKEIFDRLAAMRLERSELRSRSTGYFGRIEDKVQNWLSHDPDSTDQYINPLQTLWLPKDAKIFVDPAAREINNLQLQIVDVEEVNSDHVVSNVEEVKGGSPADQDSNSVLETDIEESDESVSVVTDLKSSRYGITYTESGMTGISFNYSAIVD